MSSTVSSASSPLLTPTGSSASPLHSASPVPLPPPPTPPGPSSSYFRRRRLGRAASPPTWACYEQIEAYRTDSSDDDDDDDDDDDSESDSELSSGSEGERSDGCGVNYESEPDGIVIVDMPNGLVAAERQETVLSSEQARSAAAAGDGIGMEDIDMDMDTVGGGDPTTTTTTTESHLRLLRLPTVPGTVNPMHVDDPPTALHEPNSTTSAESAPAVSHAAEEEIEETGEDAILRERIRALKGKGKETSDVDVAQGFHTPSPAPSSAFVNGNPHAVSRSPPTSRARSSAFQDHVAACGAISQSLPIPTLEYFSRTRVAGLDGGGTPSSVPAPSSNMLHAAASKGAVCTINIGTTAASKDKGRERELLQRKEQRRALKNARKAQERRGRKEARMSTLRPILTIQRSHGFVWNQDLFVPPYIKDRYIASTSPPVGGLGFVPSTSASSSSTSSSSSLRPNNAALQEYDKYEIEVVEIRIGEGELARIIP